ncbi:hypothetical protein NSK_005423 [Nannochloropsis salina CCMP1776]|uniref:ADP,ATP carrier protein n=1 Tax=Nannochloropsis salina CCMP1776 TaxID=1027361 RepID=A0A4D9CVD7_9STRA|nr:hypothetical protein NSK_005423 [Nannochloropsis salina CCMP1776]|eukprot:TFJ83261.1 hypothetical protein NSK_005423 [Nannochloropsis salina CCMP1776]
MTKVVTKILAGGADPSLEAEKAPVTGEWQKIPHEEDAAASSHAPSSFFHGILVTLYGEMAPRDLVRVCWFAGTLFFIIGGYWLLRSLKDSVMVAINGVEYIPQAKMVSLVVVTALVFLYNKLMDLVPKHQLFYYVGWFSYCAIESFGSIGVSLFWAFVNSTIDLEGAKKAYGLIIAGAQVGSILGPTLVIRAHSIGVPTLYFCGALCMLLMVVSVFVYVRQFGVEVDEAPSKKNGKKAGVMEGFHLFMQHAYVRGIFALSCLFMVEVTILDYMMKVLAKRYFTALYPHDPARVTDAFASFMGLFGQVTNGISFLFSLTGTSFVIRRLGLYRSLVAFPLLCMGAIAVAMLMPDLWVVFACMMFLKALSYSLNNPCKEMLYQPTNTAVKFKSKSWIDIFGQRGAKAAGSVVTNALSDSVRSLVFYGGLISVFISAFLVWVAAWMGTRFEDYTASGLVVGAEEGAEEGKEGGLKGVRVEEEGARGAETEMAPRSKMPAWTHRVGFWRKEEVLKLVGKEEKAREGKKNKSNREMEEAM